MKTQDQKFYEIDGQLKAEIDVYVTPEDKGTPSMKECRHAVLRIKNFTTSGKDSTGYVIYDRLLCRIVNDVYYMSLEEVLECAQQYNEDPGAPQNMPRNGAALGLIYPVARK